MLWPTVCKNSGAVTWGNEGTREGGQNREHTKRAHGRQSSAAPTNQMNELGWRVDRRDLQPTKETSKARNPVHGEARRFDTLQGVPIEMPDRYSDKPKKQTIEQRKGK